ncbi:MAG: phosphate ABC transporter permease PstA [Burkholderiales bacterium]|uniref:phosphate ABC transporter permease PstA n=1 Tax=Limnobacter sp. TaxID=2003368 RepID=UPI00393FB463|nr:phosphate ABC transporter permease PstA [Burkholderiales bacterium]
MSNHHQKLLATGRLNSDHLFAAVVYAAATVVAAVFVWVVLDLLLHGFAKLSWEFVTELPRSSGRKGGISSILVSTALILLITLLVAVPLAFAAAVWLSEFTRRGGKLAVYVRLSLDVLAGVPSIVFGLFGSAFFSVFMGLGYSIAAGGLTLACMVLPILTRTTEAGLSAVPDGWRQGAAALGLSKFTTLWQILLPAAAPSIAAGLMLGIGRAMAETAALIFTSGYVDRMPESIFDSGRALAVHIFDLSMNIPGGDKAAYGSALILILAIGLINALALKLSDKLLAKRIVA